MSLVVDNDGGHGAPDPSFDGSYNFESPGLYPIEIADGSTEIGPMMPVTMEVPTSSVLAGGMISPVTFYTVL